MSRPGALTLQPDALAGRGTAEDRMEPHAVPAEAVRGDASRRALIDQDRAGLLVIGQSLVAEIREREELRRLGAVDGQREPGRGLAPAELVTV
jgi:hypothetical protein